MRRHAPPVLRAWDERRSLDGDAADRPPPFGHLLMVLLLGAFACVSVVVCARKYGRGDWRFAGAHATRRDFGGGGAAAFAGVPDRDEITGLELELADGVEMM